MTVSMAIVLLDRRTLWRSFGTTGALRAHGKRFLMAGRPKLIDVTGGGADGWTHLMFNRRDGAHFNGSGIGRVILAEI